MNKLLLVAMLIGLIWAQGDFLPSDPALSAPTATGGESVDPTVTSVPPPTDDAADDATAPTDAATTTTPPADTTATTTPATTTPPADTGATMTPATTTPPADTGATMTPATTTPPTDTTATGSTSTTVSVTTTTNTQSLESLDTQGMFAIFAQLKEMTLGELVDVAQRFLYGDRWAIAHISKDGRSFDGEGFWGDIRFIQDDGELEIWVGLKTLAAGRYRLRVFEFGDLSKGCNQVGTFFNPVDPLAEKEGAKPVGDLGEFEIGANQAPIVLKVDSANLFGPLSIVGRAIVIESAGGATGGATTEVGQVPADSAHLGCGIIAHAAQFQM